MRLVVVAQGTSEGASVVVVLASLLSTDLRDNLFREYGTVNVYMDQIHANC